MARIISCLHIFDIFLSSKLCDEQKAPILQNTISAKWKTNSEWSKNKKQELCLEKFIFSLLSFRLNWNQEKNGESKLSCSKKNSPEESFYEYVVWGAWIIARKAKEEKIHSMCT